MTLVAAAAPSVGTSPPTGGGKLDTRALLVSKRVGIDDSDNAVAIEPPLRADLFKIAEQVCREPIEHELASP